MYYFTIIKKKGKEETLLHFFTTPSCNSSGCIVPRLYQESKAAFLEFFNEWRRGELFRTDRRTSWSHIMSLHGSFLRKKHKTKCVLGSQLEIWREAFPLSSKFPE